MRIFRWLPLLLAIVGIYYLAIRAKEVKADSLLASAPSRLGISERDWKHWTAVTDQIREGHIPELSQADWNHLKQLCSSADEQLRANNIQLLGFLKDTSYRSKAISTSEKATHDSSDEVRAWALENLKKLGSKDWVEKAKEMANDSSKVVRDAADKMTSELPKDSG